MRGDWDRGVKVVCMRVGGQDVGPACSNAKKYWSCADKMHSASGRKYLIKSQSFKLLWNAHSVYVCCEAIDT